MIFLNFSNLEREIIHIHLLIGGKEFLIFLFLLQIVLIGILIVFLESGNLLGGIIDIEVLLILIQQIAFRILGMNIQEVACHQFDGIEIDNFAIEIETACLILVQDSF